MVILRDRSYGERWITLRIRNFKSSLERRNKEVDREGESNNVKSDRTCTITECTDKGLVPGTPFSTTEWVDNSQGFLENMFSTNYLRVTLPR